MPHGRQAKKTANYKARFSGCKGRRGRKKDHLRRRRSLLTHIHMLKDGRKTFTRDLGSGSISTSVCPKSSKRLVNQSAKLASKSLAAHATAGLKAKKKEGKKSMPLTCRFFV